jgi:hypothetical protein
MLGIYPVEHYEYLKYGDLNFNNPNETGDFQEFLKSLEQLNFDEVE